MGAALIHDRQTDSQWGGQVKTEGVSRNYENAPKTVLKVLLCTNSANSDTGAGRALLVSTVMRHLATGIRSEKMRR